MSLKQAFWYIKFFKAKQVQLLINFVGVSNFTDLPVCFSVSSHFALGETEDRPGVKTWVSLYPGLFLRE